MPQPTRAATCSKSPQEHGIWFRARIANAVGTTQLTASGNQGQPYLSGSKRTWRSVVRNFHFQNQFDSRPAKFKSHSKPGRCRITKSHYSQRGDPATLLIISREHRPTAIRVLGTQEKLLSSFDIAYTRRAEDERRVAGRLDGWLRRRSKSGPSSTRELPQGKFGQQVAEHNRIGRHSGHFVMRNLFAVKTRRDDGDLSAVSPTIMPSERERIRA